MWKATVTLDNDKLDVGTAVAVWNEGLEDSFTYSRRVKITTAEKNAFVAEVKAALVVNQAKQAKEAEYSLLLTNALNA